jgi:uncharacterized protein (DUF1697 family)
MASGQLALLRGVNVGGKNKLPMSELAALFEEAGCSNVRTLIQSGNVVFTAGAAVSKKLAAVIEKKIEDRFGFRTPVVLRTAEELRAAIANNPFHSPSADGDALHVMFLADVPGAAQIAALDPNRSPGDRFAVHRREVYLHLPNGVARTKLSNAWFDAKLQTVSTIRNWRTVQKLLEMM